MVVSGFRTIDDLPLPAWRGRRVLLRADLNLPLVSGAVSDDERLRLVLPSLFRLTSAGARVLLVSHLGRPGGKFDEASSLFCLRDTLSSALGCEVPFASDCVGGEASLVSEHLCDGEVALLENLRFHSGELANDLDFAESLSCLADIYVNDAFSASHRSHASVVRVAALLPSYAGLGLAREVSCLDRVMHSPLRPLALVVGGAKISTKLGVIRSAVDTIKPDYLIIGGGMANSFLLSKGFSIGRSLCDLDYVETARSILSEAARQGVRVILPLDAVVASSLECGVESRCVPLSQVGGSDMILDIGVESVRLISDVLYSCKTILWNGPLGAFEFSPFGAGTFACLRVAAAVGRSVADCLTVAGGGDTVLALKLAGVFDDFSYVSLAGGAFLEHLQGTALPGLTALRSSREYS